MNQWNADGKTKQRDATSRLRYSQDLFVVARCIRLWSSIGRRVGCISGRLEGITVDDNHYQEVDLEIYYTESWVLFEYGDSRIYSHLQRICAAMI